MFLFKTIVSEKKRIDISLLDCFGLSHTTTFPVYARLGHNFSKNLSLKQKINEISMEWFVPKVIRRRKYINHGFRLKHYLYAKLRDLKRLKTFRGFRHTFFLPVRGQRTRKNAQTQKSKRINRRKIPIAKKKK